MNRSIGDRLFGGSILLPCFLLFHVLSCKKDPYPGYGRVHKGIYLKREFLGDGEHDPGIGDGVSIHYKVLDHPSKDSSISEGVLDTLLIEKDHLLFGLLDEHVEGDSSSVIVEKDPSRNDSLLRTFLSGEELQETNKALIRFKLKKVMAGPEFARWKKEKGNLKAFDQQLAELARIRGYVDSIATDPQRHFVNGIYFFSRERGDGKPVRSGQRVVVHLKGTFLDSTVFQDTYHKGTPLDFHYGDPGQVVQGVDIALGRMREGGTAEVIIPSYLAFGQDGSSTGIVPPYTPVRFRIRVIDPK